jgi:hypothetical protein
MEEIFSPIFLKASLGSKIKQIFLGYKLFSAWNEFVRAFLFRDLWLLSRLQSGTNRFFSESETG